MTYDYERERVAQIVREAAITMFEAGDVVEWHDLPKGIKADYMAYADRILAAALRTREPERPANDKLRLIEVGPRKIQVIKTVRHVCGLSLTMAKDVVESAPVVLPRIYGVSVEDMAYELGRLGARVEIVTPEERAAREPEERSEPVGERIRVSSDMLAFLRATQNRTTADDPVVVVPGPAQGESR